VEGVAWKGLSMEMSSGSAQVARDKDRKRDRFFLSTDGKNRHLIVGKKVAERLFWLKFSDFEQLPLSDAAHNDQG
jgi:hypothetical protein